MLSIALLICMVILSVLETDLYLASFPSITRYFGSTESLVQHSLSLYLLVFAIGILFAGPISDYYGRKKLFLWD